MALSDEESRRLLDHVLGEIREPARAVEQLFRTRFAGSPSLGDARTPSLERQALIGSYFTHEYSPESAALFNPSIVPHPNQTDLPRALFVSSSAYGPRAKGTSPPSLSARGS
jgi:hypothetical protein